MTTRQAAKPARQENPLVPDRRLRQIYTAMVEMRQLEDYLTQRALSKPQSAPSDTLRGEEAARSSTALSLGTGDLILDRSAAAAMALLLGADLAGLTGTKAHTRTNTASSTKTSARACLEVPPALAEYPLTLPVADHPFEQVQRALGAAAVLKAQGEGRVLLMYARASDLGRKAWKKALVVAAGQELPLLLVALPELHRKAKSHMGELAESSRGWGVPGFPVDGSDAIALYRVMQESLLRARSGGGPALLECISFPVDRKFRDAEADPLERMAELLKVKGVADEVWMRRARSAFSRRLPRARAPRGPAR